MDAAKLRKQLIQLHDAIEKAPPTDEKGRKLLRDIDGHIQELLARSEDAIEPRPALSSGLEDAIRHFEVTHPALTTALSDLVTALSNAGI